jgi:hypothetical protein
MPPAKMAPTGPRVKEKLNHNRENHAPQTGLLCDNAADEGSSSNGMLAKDETEERLERLLFGDDAGFIEGLKARPVDGQLTIRPDQQEVDAGFEGEEDLESIADENVRYQPRVL